MKRILTRFLLAFAVSVLGLVLALCIAGLLYREKLEIPAGFAGKHLAVDGLSLRVLQEGVGRDLLFMHGSPGALEEFAPQVKALSGSFRIARYDQRGVKQTVLELVPDSGHYSNPGKTSRLEHRQKTKKRANPVGGQGSRSGTQGALDSCRRRSNAQRTAPLTPSPRRDAS